MPNSGTLRSLGVSRVAEVPGGSNYRGVKSAPANALIDRIASVENIDELRAAALDSAARAALRAMRKRMQVVLQDLFASLSPRMTVGQIVGEGLVLHRADLSKAQRDDKILAILDGVGLSAARGRAGVLQRYPHEFSGGQRQRKAIARTVLLELEAWMLDELTSPFEASVQQQVLALLADLQRSHGLS